MFALFLKKTVVYSGGLDGSHKKYSYLARSKQKKHDWCYKQYWWTKKNILGLSGFSSMYLEFLAIWIAFWSWHSKLYHRDKSTHFLYGDRIFPDLGSISYRILRIIASLERWILKVGVALVKPFLRIWRDSTHTSTIVWITLIPRTEMAIWVIAINILR